MDFVKVLLILVALIPWPGLALAKCRHHVPRDHKITLVVKSCRVLNPSKDTSLSDHALGPFFTGALITDKKGREYFFASVDPSPCRPFKRGKRIYKMATYTCCDTGAWGKCRFGGRFLYNFSGPKVNSFQ